MAVLEWFLVKHCLGTLGVVRTFETTDSVAIKIVAILPEAIVTWP